MEKQHFAGLAISLIRGAIKRRNDLPEAYGCKIEIDQLQENHIYGIHQARIKIEGDDNIYRLILAPLDAPLRVGPCEIDQHFLNPMKGAE
jgi:hypothetical protein